MRQGSGTLPFNFGKPWEARLVNFVVSGNDLMTYVFGIIAMLMALVLAWRGYRSLAKEDRARKAANKKRDGR